MLLKRTLLAAWLITFGLLSQPFAQNYLMDGQPIRDCDGIFLDSGGGGNNYSPNENFSTTICPGDMSGSHIKLTFSGVVLGNGDRLCFYDDNTANPAKFLSCSNDFEPGSPFIIQATAINPTGCITVTFQSDGNSQGAGWGATIDCINECQVVQSRLRSSDPSVVPVDTGWIDICPGERVFFEAAGFYPQNGFVYQQTDLTSTFEWDFGDGSQAVGPVSSHIFEESGGYIVQVTITDVRGCKSTNFISQRVRVATAPTFNLGGDLDREICVGDTLNLNAITGSNDPNRSVSVIPNEGEFSTGGIRSDSLALPDGTGSAYQEVISITGFGPGQTVMNGSDIVSICVNMEHSWMRDMEISITCPDGNSIVLHDHPGNVGGMVLLGEPIDFDGQNPTPGVGYDYCWTPSATRGTWLSFANSTFGLFGSGTLPEGDYNPFDHFNNLIGCPMNGEWKIRVEDHWAQDNGFIFSWSINFEESLYPDLERFTPNIVNAEWIPNSTIFFQNNDSLAASPKNAGNPIYTFEVLDEFGCTWDTMIQFTVLPEMHPDCHECETILSPQTDTVVCNGESLQLDVTSTLPTADSTTFETFPNEPIGYANYPAANPYRSVLNVNSLFPMNLSDPFTQIESVCFDLSTDFAWDIQAFLRSPSGAVMELTTNNGGMGGYRNTCFTPTAVQSIRLGFAPFTGNFQPEGNWSVLQNSSVNGDWSLQISDVAGINDFGTLHNWSITFRAENNITYQWVQGGSSLSCTDCPNPIATPTQSTTYIVRATDSYNCSTDEEIDVSFFSSPAPQVRCAGSANRQVSFDWTPVSGATGYEVNINNAGWIPVAGLSYAAGPFNPGDFADIRVRAVFTNTLCFSEIGVETCRYILCEIQTQVEKTDVTCNGNSDGRAIIHASNGLAPYQFSLNGSAFRSDSTFRALSPGDYTVIVLDDLLCRDTQIFTIQETDPIQLSTSVVKNVACFGGNDGMARVTATGGDGNYTYLWNDPLQQISSEANQLTAGNYSVIVTDGNGCSGNATVTIAQPDRLEVTVTKNDVRCRGDATGSATALLIGGTSPYQFSWNDPKNQTGQTAVDLPAGNYLVSVTDDNGCFQFGTVSILQPSTTVSVETRQLVKGCFGSGKSEAISSATGGTGTNYTFLWSNGQRTPAASNLSAQSYFVTVADENGCEKIDSIQIIEWDSMEISVVVDTPNCHGERSGALGVTLVLGGSGVLNPDGFQWNTNESGQYIGNLQGSRTYTVTVTDAQGCSNSKDVFLPEPPALIGYSSVSHAKCFGSSDGTGTVTSVDNARLPLSYLWDSNTGNQITQTATGLSAGIYTVTFTDSKGCDGTTSVDIGQPSPIQVDFQITDNDCFGAGVGSILALPSGGTPLTGNVSYQINWSNQSSGPSIGNLTTGAYVVTVTDANGCQKIDTALVSEPGTIIAELFAQPATCFGDRDGSIRIEASGGNPPFQYSLDGINYSGTRTIVGLRAGEYEVYIKDSKGCQWVDKIQVIQPQKFEVDAGPPLIEIRLGEEVTLLANSFNGQGTVSYEWDAPYPGTLTCEFCDTTVSIPQNTIIYTLFGTDEIGCRASDKIEIRVIKDRIVLVPTGFTPNNDSNNDILLVHGREGTLIKLFQVFDRWGELVFEARDFPINDILTGWDGNFRGQPLNPGVFSWHLEVEYLDGGRDSFNGHTTLIR